MSTIVLTCPGRAVITITRSESCTDSFMLCVTRTMVWRS